MGKHSAGDRKVLSLVVNTQKDMDIITWWERQPNASAELRAILRYYLERKSVYWSGDQVIIQDNPSMAKSNKEIPATASKETSADEIPVSLADDFLGMINGGK